VIEGTGAFNIAYGRWHCEADPRVVNKNTIKVLASLQFGQIGQIDQRSKKDVFSVNIRF
jgi:hypothetical protein